MFIGKLTYRFIFSRILILLALYIVVHLFVISLYSKIFNDKETEIVVLNTTIPSSHRFRIDDRLLTTQKEFKFLQNNLTIFGRTNFEVFPSNGDIKNDDRIYNQMRYVPQNYENDDRDIKNKSILLISGRKGVHFGNFQSCPVSKCQVSEDNSRADTADVVLWIQDIVIPQHRRPPHQIWSILFHESPMHTPSIKNFEKKTKSLINWTISYRPDSTIYFPYYKYSPYDLINPPPETYPLSSKNYALGKTKVAAWFSSNCSPSNNRNEIVQELQKYIKVDTYGKCGILKCPKVSNPDCFDFLNKDYKFYLSFENSNCRYYITEKFFKNGLSHNVIPIVLGAHPDDYKMVAPPHSYIHVDDFKTIKDLADYLKMLDKNDTAFNEYFSWKNYGTVHFEHYFYCRLCMMAHEADRVKTHYTDIYRWWYFQKKPICFRQGKWRDYL